MYPNQYKISIIVAIKWDECLQKVIFKAIDSVLGQKYKNIELILVVNSEDNDLINRIIERKDERIEIVKVNGQMHIEKYWERGVGKASGDYLGIMEQEAFLDENALLYVVEVANEYPNATLITMREDVFYCDKYQFNDDKEGIEGLIGGKDKILYFSLFPKNEVKEAVFNTLEWAKAQKKDNIKVIPKNLYHINPVKDLWDRKTNVRCLAFYLPQYHRIPENDKFWGEGFTEWDNVKNAHPLYKNHKQPRIPDKFLGYYDLGDCTGDDVQKKQIELAKKYGLSGFCYYFYWFDNGKRLLEKPLDRHVKNKDWDFPFCLCWANENWTRSWDGLEKNILVPQTYLENWEEQFARDIVPYMKDERYIKVNGKPFLLIYNIADLKKPYESINKIREAVCKYGISQIHISVVRRTLDASERELTNYSIDSLTDFPPHLVGQVGIDIDDYSNYGLSPIQVKDYRKACEFHANMKRQPYTYFRTAILKWDNTARKGDKGFIFENFSYDEYKKWLYGIKRYTIRQNMTGEDLLFINAWNEWAEGTYLEPDEDDGFRALETTKEVLEMI
jgi:hypothetical protein